MTTKDIFQKIRQIQYESTQISEELLAGAWHSAFKGQGMEFEEVRQYQPGDDIRTIDWKVSARMDEPHVKVFREERELTVYLLVDISASCNFGSGPTLKREVMAQVGALLAFSAIKNNDRIGLILFSDHIEKYIPPNKGTRHVLHIIRQLLAFKTQSTQTNFESALNFFGNIQRRSSISFILSDFLSPIDSHRLSILSKKHDLIAISFTDPTEKFFPNVDMVTIRDLEQGKITTIDTKNNSVEKNHNDRLNTIENLMRKVKGGYIPIETDRPYLPEVQKFFALRQRKSHG